MKFNKRVGYFDDGKFEMCYLSSSHSVHELIFLKMFENSKHHKPLLLHFVESVIGIIYIPIVYTHSIFIS